MAMLCESRVFYGALEGVYFASELTLGLGQKEPAGRNDLNYRLFPRPLTLYLEETGGRLRAFTRGQVCLSQTSPEGASPS